MLFSYKWLSELVDISMTNPTELADKMSRTGIEVEEVVVQSEGLKGIVVGDVKECVPHPDSDHLSVCQVDVGAEELSQIVCGAPNIAAGQKVIVALPNSRIAGNVKIKKGKMRGQVSMGMICSLQEVGFSESVVPKEYADGIFVLPSDAKPGESVFPYLELDDAIVELSITPNRADALSMRGIAYEVGAIYRQTPQFPIKNIKENEASAIEQKLTVQVTNPADAPNYRMRLVEGVKVTASPLWLQTRLMNAGIRPINNIVDVTNYVLLLFGQPLHAFDYDALGSQEIIVRRGQTGEKIITLDGEERELSAENIVITNGQVPVALAGVMGGLDSEITDKTVNVAIEAASFAPGLVRKTAKQFGLRSESSSRFEKGINLATIEEALDFAAAMMAELGQGTVASGTIVASHSPALATTVAISLSQINRALGTDLSTEIVNEIFTALAFDFKVSADEYQVTIPARRWDIAIPADLVEEVARLYGYDNLPATLPSGEALPGGLSREQQLTRRLREVLTGNGVSEAISYALTTEEKAQQFVHVPTPLVRLASPMSEDHAVLRQSLISGLLTDIAYNVARKQPDVRLFEIGNTFSQAADGQLPTQTKQLAVALTGNWQNKNWQGKAVKVDYFLVKGMLENIFSALGVNEKIRYQATSELTEMHPGRTALIQLDDEVLGFIGQVHPQIAKNYGIADTFVVELQLPPLFAKVAQQTNYQDVSKYPSMKRDIALLVDETVSNQSIVETIQANGGKYLQSVQLFDLFAGEKLGLKKKSLAYSLVFQDNQATLVDEAVNKAMNKIIAALETNFEVEVR